MKLRSTFVNSVPKVPAKNSESARVKLRTYVKLSSESTYVKFGKYALKVPTVPT